MSQSSEFQSTGKIKFDQMMLLSSKEKKGTAKNSYKMQKMMKKLGTQSKINEIQKMLEQIREEKKREKKAKNLPNEYLLMEPCEDDTSKLRSLTENEDIDKTLDKTASHEFLSRKSIASQTVGAARKYIKNQNPCFFDVPRQFLKPHNPGFVFQKMMADPESDPANPFKGLKCLKKYFYHSEIFEETSSTAKRENKREENFIMNYSRSQNLKKSLINKRRNETISQRVANQKLPDLFVTQESRSPLRLITEFNTSFSKHESDRKESTNTFKTENFMRLRPIAEERKRSSPIEHLKNKNNEISELIKTIKDDKLKKAMEMFKLSLENEGTKGKSTGFKNTISFGYVGYLLKSDYFAKQEKKEYLNNSNQYPNRKNFFFHPHGSNHSLFPEPKKRPSNFNEYLYDLDPTVSPLTLEKNIKEFSQSKGSKETKDIENKQKELLECAKQYVRKEEQEYYLKNLNHSSQNISFRKNYQKDLMKSNEVKKEIFDFYNKLLNYHENEAKIKNFKDTLMNSFKGYDENFLKILKELIKYNDNLRKIENEKKTFTFDIEEYAPHE